jgi:thiosulfate dehydrogenase [quinone] large subunit
MNQGPKTMNNKVLAYTMFRLFLGLNMFMHGAVRLGPNYQKFITWTQGVFADSWLPNWLVTLEASLIPGVELVIGVLLVLGYKTRFAILLAVALMATLVFGMNVVQNWELVNRHIIYVMAFYILMHNLEFNQYSIDARQ